MGFIEVQQIARLYKDACIAQPKPEDLSLGQSLGFF